MIVVHKGTHYKRKTHKKTGALLHDACANKCHIKSGSKKCNNIFIHYCGYKEYFVKINPLTKEVLKR